MTLQTKWKQYRIIVDYGAEEVMTYHRVANNYVHALQKIIDSMPTSLRSDAANIKIERVNVR